MTALTGSIQLARKTAAQWAEQNPVLLDGQFAIESDTNKVRCGDGVTHYADLGPINITPEGLSAALAGIELSDYVQKEAGKGLSSNDYTTAEKNKLAGIAAGATANRSDAATDAAISAQVAALVNSSPVALDTLKELADALGNDANFAATVTNSLAGKEPVIAAGAAGQYWRGDKTWRDLAPDVLSVVLTGITALTGTIVATDTIFMALRRIKNFMDTLVAATVSDMTIGTDNAKYITPKGLADYSQEWATTDTDIIAAITGATYDPANNNIANITPANGKVFKFSQIYVGGGQLYYALSDNIVLLVGRRNVLKRFTATGNGTNTVTIPHGLPDITSTTPFLPFAMQTPAIVSATIDSANITIVHSATIANLAAVAYNINISLT